ncbi:MAG: esterase [Methylococcaceae bacterium]|nr:esterase [Methylococcaceae bacterium]
MNREYHKWWSNHLHRDMELLVFGHAGAKVLIFPTRKGRFYEYENMGMVSALQHKIDQGLLQLYCIDSIDNESLYCGWAHPHGRIERQKLYESYILHEVLPFMQHKNQHDCVISHGLSLGAFQAANIAFRHPHLFKKLVAFSGRYDLTLNVESFNDLFDGFYSEDIYFNMPTHYLPNLDCPWRVDHLRAMDITLVIGQEDPFLDNNHYLSSILSWKDIHHHLQYWHDRAHSPRYWRQMAPVFI